MTADPVALARDLLRCPSVTPAEGGALALLERVLAGAGFAVHRITFSEPGTAPVDNLYARIGTGCAASDVRRAHRRRSGRRRGHLVAPALRRRDRRRHALRPRRGRHEGRHRLRGRGHARLRLAAALAQGLDLVPDHRRRGRHRGQRHREAPAMGGCARRKIRPLHPGRADEHHRTWRHHQDRPTRLAERHAGRDRQAGPRRLSRARRQPRARAHCVDDHADGGTDRSREQEFRTFESRIHFDRHRQHHGQPYSRRGARALQHPLQRPAHARLAAGFDRRACAGGSR